jgi:hypothetical protein
MPARAEPLGLGDDRLGMDGRQVLAVHEQRDARPVGREAR